jgi:prolyl oligopeptidase
MYPRTRVDEVSDTLAGVSFPDPYRWLESESTEVLRWQGAQSQLTDRYVSDWPHFERLRALVAHYNTEVYFDHVVLPQFAGGKWFRARTPEGASQSQAIVGEEPLGEGRVLFDPLSESADRPPFLSWLAPSPDGRTLAIGLCPDGSERNTIRLIDVETGRLLLDAPPHTLMDANTGGVQWLADSSGFFFTAIEGPAIAFEQHVYLHRRLPTPTTQRVEVEWSKSADYRLVVVSRDGRFAVALERCLNPIPVAIADLSERPLRWRRFITSVCGTVAGEIVGDRYIAVTDIGAKRGRVVSIPIACEDPSDDRNWQELVPESEAVLRTVTPVGQVLYLTELVDTYARVRIVDRAGTPVGEVPLPGRGAVVSASIYPMLDLISKGPADRFLFAFSSLTVSRGIYSHTPGSSSVETLMEPRARLENAMVEDRWAVSADGTRIPYHVVRRADVSAQQPQPTLICAYGAFGAAWVPQFPGPMAAFVAAGGVFVHAHLRGGGELGADWWHGGRMEKKQNCYDDLFAIAEDLIAAKRTSSALLAVTGESNGGLMAGVALAQRPDLWAVSIPRVAVLDLIGSCRNPYGRWARRLDFGDLGDPVAVRRLATISPYHLVREGVGYPAVFLDAGGTDPRCPPWHARKLAARLQRATSSQSPILLRVWGNVGHGAATNKHVAVVQYTEWLAFTMRHLGMSAQAQVATQNRARSG